MAMKSHKGAFIRELRPVLDQRRPRAEHNQASLLRSCAVEIHRLALAAFDSDDPAVVEAMAALDTQAHKWGHGE